MNKLEYLFQGKKSCIAIVMEIVFNEEKGK